MKTLVVVMLLSALAFAAGEFSTGGSELLKFKGTGSFRWDFYGEEEEDFQSGLGWGDVKLAACLGAFLGPGSAVAGLFLSFLTGALYGVAVLIRGGRRTRPIPFGPFMAVGGAVALFFGNWLWNAYSSFGSYR